MKRLALLLSLAALPSAFGASIYNSLVPGTNTLAANDDGSSPLTAIGFTTNFFGTNYTNLFCQQQWQRDLWRDAEHFHALRSNGSDVETDHRRLLCGCRHYWRRVRVVDLRDWIVYHQ